MTPQETEPDLPVSVQESLAEAWVNMACCRVGALNTTVHAQILLKEVAIVFITLTIIWPQAKQQGGNSALPINRKWGILAA